MAGVRSGPMRILALPLLILVLAAPAAAQPYRDLAQARDAQALADAQAARLRDITQTNDLGALQARVQSEQAISNIQAQRAAPLPAPLPGPHAVAPVVDPRNLVSIPDAALAQSNARVRAVADNPR